MNLTPEQSKRIKELLPRGQLATIAKQLNVHHSLVYRTLAGKVDSPRVIQALVDAAEAIKKTKEDISNRIDEL